jgi:hypothetical protein
MTIPRVGCAARILYRDRHQCVERWWTLTTPNGEEHALCSAACVLSWIVYESLPAEVEESRQAGEAA